MGKNGSLQQLFETSNKRRTYPKGSIIIMQGSNLDQVYRISEGLVRVYDIDLSGSQRTVALFSKNHIIPAVWLQSENPPTEALYFYQAITPVICYAILTNEARNFIKTHPKATRQLLDAVNRAYLNALSRMQNLQRSQVGERVDFILYYLAIVFGQPSLNKKVYEIPALITHQEIADLSGLSRETVSSCMVGDRYKNIIIKKKNRTYINLNKLDIESMPKVFPFQL